MFKHVMSCLGYAIAGLVAGWFALLTVEYFGL
jgi:hypothetical protein